MDASIRSTDEVLAELNSGGEGLSFNEIERRREKYGSNILEAANKEFAIKIFLRQFESPIIYILLASAIAVFALGDTADGIIILAVLIINAIIGAFQEGRAQNTLFALRSMVVTNAVVIRNGKEMIIPSGDLVPGDVFILRAGDKVPADGRIIEAQGLKVDEAALTGESESVRKTADVLSEAVTSPADRKNMVFNGTYTIEGEGRVVVTAIGKNTVIGAISEKLEELDVDVPLKAHISVLSRLIIVVVSIFCFFIFAVGLLKGIELREMFITVIAIFVSAIPEGLPVVVTVVLATGVYRMSRRYALVRRLQAVEALGQATVIALDKTGTITLNQMMVEKLYVGGAMYDVSGRGYEPVGDITKDGSRIETSDHEDIMLAAKVAVLTTSAAVVYSKEKKEWERIHGDPTEAALLTFSRKIGFEKTDLENEHKKIFEIPFTTETKYHAAVHDADDKAAFSVAGAPEVILESVKRIWKNGKAHPIQAADMLEIKRILLEMSKLRLRIVALAMRFDSAHMLMNPNLPELCFVGFLGISDSIRPEVPQALLDAKRAGVKVVMITGDHMETARAVALKAGVYKDGDEIITGKDLSYMSEEELASLLPRASIFARVSPEDKLKIIEAYRRNGNVVAMTGDGVNDALSLAAADLGVAMGKIGTDVAKEASDIVLQDDNFGSIVAAIEEGRNIYRTIKKVIFYLFSTSLGEIFTITAALLFGYPLPLLASQIIWLNFVTDGFLVAALAFEPKGRHLLERSEMRLEKYILDKTTAMRMILLGLVMMAGTLYLFDLYLGAEGFIKASTVALTMLAVYQWFNAWNSRSDKRSVFTRDIFSNRLLVAALGIVVILQLCAVYVSPLQKILHTTALSLFDWGIILAMGVSIVVVEEVRKFFVRKRG